jgi:hypothetical protein
LQPKAVEELENRYDALLSNVTRLHREITNLNKRASVRPAPAGTVAEGEQQVTSTMAFDSRWVPPVGGAPSRHTRARRCVRLEVGAPSRRCPE